MEKMKTSWFINYKEQGFTLFETLAVVFLLASIATVSLIAFQPALGSARLEYAASQLHYDLKNARRYARANAATVDVEFREGGYTIPLLEVNKALETPLYLSMTRGDRFFFSPDGLSPGAVISLGNGKRSMTFTVEALTGRIRQQ